MTVREWITEQQGQRTPASATHQRETTQRKTPCHTLRPGGQDVCFWLAKRYLLACERIPFGTQKHTFYLTECIMVRIKPFRPYQLRRPHSSTPPAHAPYGQSKRAQRELTQHGQSYIPDGTTRHKSTQKEGARPAQAMPPKKVCI